ncbi:hypothetical protein BC938DRAFT_474268 [Jimgerdemannia flammicorona]|uniref:Uncharacterized protein n=1 Tax=Jimgerdemannia flammicorona TaxID=994334 RepID=A0A433Q2M1_9FUNG|nr:hypothetical protein BC938DRAFT_474268 [Jimgerdemannia flammicorona]
MFMSTISSDLLTAANIPGSVYGIVYTANSVANKLGTIYDKAEPLYERALAINEKVLGPEPPDMPGLVRQGGAAVRTGWQSMRKCWDQSTRTRQQL